MTTWPFYAKSLGRFFECTTRRERWVGNPWIWYVGCPVVESWRVKKINVAICDDLEPWKLFSDKFWLLYLHSELLQTGDRLSYFFWEPIIGISITPLNAHPADQFPSHFQTQQQMKGLPNDRHQKFYASFHFHTENYLLLSTENDTLVSFIWISEGHRFNGRNCFIIFSVDNKR